MMVRLLKSAVGWRWWEERGEIWKNFMFKEKVSSLSLSLSLSLSHTHTHTHTRARAHGCIITMSQWSCILFLLQLCMYAAMYVYAYIYICMYVCIICMCMYVCMWLSIIYVCMYILSASLSERPQPTGAHEKR